MRKSLQSIDSKVLKANPELLLFIKDYEAKQQKFEQLKSNVKTAKKEMKAARKEFKKQLKKSRSSKSAPQNGAALAAPKKPLERKEPAAKKKVGKAA